MRLYGSFATLITENSDNILDGYNVTELEYGQVDLCCSFFIISQTKSYLLKTYA